MKLPRRRFLHVVWGAAALPAVARAVCPMTPIRTSTSLANEQWGVDSSGTA
jgi:hypothetical protein